MLLELRVENLLLIERAELALAPGLNVLTGETGAGKTVLAQALDLLLGGRPGSGIVRPGAREAYVEGVFALSSGVRAELAGQLPDDLAERLPDDADELVLARRVGRDGRTRAYVGGRSATVAELRAVAAQLIVFYGQHEHRRLALASAQLEILDGFCGPEQLERRHACAAAHARAGELEASVAELHELARARERELDLLAFELEEIESVAPDAAEQEALLAERERLRHYAGLRDAARGAAHALAPDSDAGTADGAAALLAAATIRLDAVAGVDAELDALAERCRTLALEAEDAARELGGYDERLEAEPGRLEAVEQRLDAIARLERKHGGTVAAVLAHAERCRARRDELEGAEVALEQATGELATAFDERDKRLAGLHTARAAAAPELAAAVRERLAELAMPGASFEIDLRPRDAGPTGGDQVEFEIAPNPGVPAGPLREIASGGELSRVMLALMSVANDRGCATLVFDEVDAGIGGHTSRAVGEQLRALAAGRQVLCITHLAQIASLGARHFAIAKDIDVEPARTTVTELADAAVVVELVRMLGAHADDAAARRHAHELLRAA